MEVSPIVDEKTIILAKKGDLAALNEIIIVFQRAIFNHLYRLTGSQEDAADLTQDTFFKLYRKRQLIDPEQNFKAWLYKIATNTAYDWFTKKNKINEIVMPEEDEFETNGHELPYYRIDEVGSNDIEIALEKIKPKYKVVISLYYQQGFSYGEIAEIMKVPLGTVKTLLRRAKKALSDKIIYGKNF